VPYEPASAGAVPSDSSPSDGSLFGRQDDARNPFSGNAPTPTRRPSTALARDREGARLNSNETAVEGSERPAPEEPGRQAAAITRTRPVGSVEKIGPPKGVGRLDAIQDLDPTTPEDDPFAPLGLRVGTFILRPSLEQGLTYTTNADYSPNGTDALLSETTLRLNAISDWSEHSASLDAYGTFRDSLSGYDLRETSAGALAALNLNLGEETRARTTLGYERAPETASSPVTIEGTVSEPIRQTFSGSIGVEREVGRALFAATGRVEHDRYGDAELSNGDSLSQEDRNSTLATLSLRAGYEISPVLMPFLEGEVGRRFYQKEVDSAGFERSSDRLGARAGLAVDLGEKLSGEVSGGWIREQFDDDRLAPIEGPTLNALITWSPERETTVVASASTTVEGTTNAGESGSILHSGEISLERQVRSNLTANGLIGAGYRDYSGGTSHDLLFNAQVGATWWLNRYTGITGRLRHESLRSNIDGRDYDASSVFLGMTLQR
jgi:hypothetical protein